MTKSTLLGLLAVLGLCLGGCSELDTTYGTWEKSSVNGMTVLRKTLETHYRSRHSWMLSDRLADDAMIIGYVENHWTGGAPDTATQEWIEEWLHDVPGRHLLLFLRDQSMGSWLCQRWISEAEQRRDQLPENAEDKRQEIDEQIARLRERAEEEEDASIFTDHDWQFFRRDHMPERNGKWALTTDAPLTIPPFFSATAKLEPQSDYPLTPIISIDGACQAAWIEVGDSRLTVVSNTLPFLNAAQVDPSARAWMDAFVASLPPASDDEIWWLRNMSLGDGNPQTPSVLSMIFATPPFNVIVIHFFLLVGLWLWFRSAWLGRVNASKPVELQHFDQHIDTLAKNLAHSDNKEVCRQAIDTYFHSKNSPTGQQRETPAKDDHGH